ncbi:MAG: phosphomannomutase/phosphoglucomutase [Candidatus Nanoarchaeia archaeon]
MTKLSYIHSYDIRGVVGDDLTAQEIRNIAKAIASVYDLNKIIIGFDMRESSQGFCEAMQEEFTQYGIDVLSIGLSSTPQLYFATAKHDCDFGIIITASHNPSKYNGMKLCRENSVPIAYGTGLESIEECIVNSNYKEYSNLKKGSVESISIQEEYEEELQHALEGFNPNTAQRLKVVVDYGNGITGHSNKQFIDMLEKNNYITAHHLFVEPDGSFPNHEANPIKEENLKQLQEAVTQKQFDLGISFDGDGDRVGFVDERGKYVAADVIGAFLVEHLSKHRGEDFKSFCYDLRSTRKIVEIGDAYNKPHSMTRVGHSHIKQTMIEQDAQFACELSGHFYFESFNDSKFDDALRAFIEVICAASYYEKSFSEIMSDFYNPLKSSEINFTVDDADEKMEESKSWFNELGEFTTTNVDGVLYENEDFWVNIRKSNTEPLLRVNYEVKSEDEELYNKIIQIVKEKLKE